MNNLLQTKFRWLLVFIVSILSVFALTTSALASGKSEIDANDNQFTDMSAVATNTHAPTATPTSPTPFQAGNGEDCILLSSGIINVGGSLNVNFVAPEGKMLIRYCVKAQGEAPEYVDVRPLQANVLISHSSGKGIVHFSVFYWVIRPVTTSIPAAVTSTLAPATPTPTTTPIPVVGLPPTGGSPPDRSLPIFVVLLTLIGGLDAAIGVHALRRIKS